MNLAGHIEEQAKAVDRNPTDGQKEAGNYRKGHVKIHGLDISIENPRGSYRSGTDLKTSKPWRAQLPHHYGYIRKTEGNDGDHVDVYLGPHLKSPRVFVIDQHHLTGNKPFDEHKTFIGFGSETQAREAYHRAFSDGRGKDRIGHIKAMTVDEFKDWLDGDTTSPVKHRAEGGKVRAEKALPPNHQLGMKVPKGGSMCANCRFLASPTTCGNEGFIRWNGGAKLPDPADEYCCDLFETAKARADGGRVHMANGGEPDFDPDVPATPIAAEPDFDPNVPMTPIAPAKSSGWTSYIPAAVSDIPHEIGNAATEAWNKITPLADRSQQGSVEGLLTTGRAALAVPQLLASPITGAARSLIGHPMAQAEHIVGNIINPEVAAKDDPQKMYEQAKQDVDLAMSAARPGGAPVKVGGAYEWTPPASPSPNLKPVGVVKQPETADFFDAADNHYANMRGFGVEIHPNAMNQVADNITTELMAEGYRPRNAPKVFDAVEELRNPAGQNHEISDIDSVRKVLGKARLDPSERDAARRAVGHIDDYLANLGNNPQDVVVNPHFAGRVGEEATSARANYAVAKRSEDIDEALEKAQRQAGRAGAGGNINNAIRQQLSSLRNNRKKMAGWNDDEKAELDAVIHGSASANAARQAGKFAPHGIVSTVMSAGTGHMIAPGFGEIAVPAGGWIAKKIGDRMTRLSAERLQNVIKARSPLGRQTSINAAAQSALARPYIPRKLPTAVRAGLPSPVPGVSGIYPGLQGPIPAGADQEQP